MKTAEDILNAKLESGKAQTAAILARIQNEVPQDRLVKANALRFAADHHSDAAIIPELVMQGGKTTEPLTRHALSQACARVGFPSAYAAEVMEEKAEVGRVVVAEALSTLWQHEPDNRKVLVRSVNGRAHGLLSDAYRRLDGRPGVDAFCGAAMKLGAVPIEGVITETRIAIKAVLPRIFTLGNTVRDPHGSRFLDKIVIGAVLRNSDFGAGRYSMALYILRVLCLNGMIGDMLFAQTHVGARLDEADFFSDRTHKLDAATMVSATRDYVNAFLSPDGIEKTVGVLQAAASTSLDLEKEINGVLKKAMTVDERKSLTAALQSVNEEEMPLGPPTPWRMANAISWVAAHTEDADRTLDLQRLAGNYLKAA